MYEVARHVSTSVRSENLPVTTSSRVIHHSVSTKAIPRSAPTYFASPSRSISVSPSIVPATTIPYRQSPLAHLPTTTTTSYRIRQRGVATSRNDYQLLRSVPFPTIGTYPVDFQDQSPRRYRVAKRKQGTCGLINSAFCGACDRPNGWCAQLNQDGRCDRGGRYLVQSAN